MDQPKLERLLRLMKLLTANTTYNVDQLAERLQMSRRTVYRYIDTFREAGFVIKKSGDCIRLDKESPHFRDISQLVQFTEEEAVILKNTIENIDDTNMLKQNLKRKLYSVYDNKTLADTVVRGKNAPNIRRLIEAIEQERQAVLHGYLSADGAGAGLGQLLRQRQPLGRKGKIRTVHGLVPSRYSVVKAGSYSLLRA